jgi:ADP-heptose:LPS heptosyltransferase
MKQLILRSFSPPGDVLMLTAAIRDLHRTYPGEFVTGVRTKHAELWRYNPFIRPLAHSDSVQEIECSYPLIRRSDSAPSHFLEGFVHFLNERLNVRIELTEFRGDVYLSEEEKIMPSPASEIRGYGGAYWIIVSGGKADYTIKWWDVRRFQEVVDHFRGGIQFVQVGAPGHFHPELSGVIDLRARTDLRQLIRLVYHADGIVCPVTFLMHLAAAVPNKLPHRLRPCVVIAGGREPPHWEAYPGHQYLHTVGMLPCCRTGGCWRARTKPLRDGSYLNRPEHLCVDVAGDLPRCMDMITAGDVIRRIEMYLQAETQFQRLVELEAQKIGLTGTFWDHVSHVNRPAPEPSSGKNGLREADLIIRYYQESQLVPKRRLTRDLSEHALTNTPFGLGDTLLLTQLPWVGAWQGKRRYIASPSPYFEPLVRFNPHFVPAGRRQAVAADHLQLRYDLGNGHLIQRLQRAFGLIPDLIPRGFLGIPEQPIPGRVVLHFEAGSSHVAWQRIFIHPRARQLYPQSRRIIERFIDAHPEMTFCQVGNSGATLTGVEDCTGLSLEQTIKVISCCEYFLGIISGPMHLATAMRLKCVVILNFPHAAEIFLPTLKDIDLIESEWLYPQNVHLHQDNEGPLVKGLSLKNLEKAFQGELYPYWSDRFLSLIHEKGHR